MKRITCIAIVGVLLLGLAGIAAEGTGTLLYSWEDGTEGWKVHNDKDHGAQAAGIGTGEKGTTDGKSALSIALKTGYHNAVAIGDPALAGKLKGAAKISVDFTANDSTSDGFIQVGVATVADGMPYAATEVQEVTKDDKPHTLTFDVSAWKIPDHPSYYVLWIITNTPDGAKVGSVYVDNMRVLTK